MIVTSLSEIKNTKRDVSGSGWRSRRLLLAADGMGYTLTDTLILEGRVLEMEYKHHFEACYCIEGKGEIEDMATGVIHPLAPFTVYALNRRDRHRVRAVGGNMRLFCVFTPPSDRGGGPPPRRQLCPGGWLAHQVVRRGQVTSNFV